MRSCNFVINKPAGANATDELFSSIQGLMVRALLAVQPAMINDKHSFEVGHICEATTDKHVACQLQKPHI